MGQILRKPVWTFLCLAYLLFLVSSPFRITTKLSFYNSFNGHRTDLGAPIYKLFLFYCARGLKVYVKLSLMWFILYCILVFALLGYHPETSKLLVEARRMGMFNGEYVFITMDFEVEKKWEVKKLSTLEIIFGKSKFNVNDIRIV